MFLQVILLVIPITSICLIIQRNALTTKTLHFILLHNCVFPRTRKHLKIHLRSFHHLTAHSMDIIVLQWRLLLLIKKWAPAPYNMMMDPIMLSHPSSCFVSNKRLMLCWILFIFCILCSVNDRKTKNICR